MARGDDQPILRSKLLHPVYLDVPMMISFLAALRGGVAFEDTATRRDARSTTRDREAGAKVRLPPLTSLLGFDASGRMGRSERDEASEEVEAVRQHTAASLFNSLYEALIDEELLKVVEGAADLAGISPGDVVEITGDFVGNPLEAVIAFYKQALPYFSLAGEMEDPHPLDGDVAQAEVAEISAETDDLAQRAKKAARSGSPARQAEAVALEQRADKKRRQGAELEAVQAAAPGSIDHQQMLGIRMFDQVGEDLATTPVQDTVINAGDLKAILTMSAEFFTDATRAHLRAGVFRAVGKVTRVLQEGDDVNLLRRTVLGAAGPEIGREMFKNVEEERGLELETFDPIIAAPAIQILPLAVSV